MSSHNRSTGADWPELSYAAGHDTWSTVHLWSQVVGKVRLVQTPWTNHSWHVPLYVTVRGLTTSPIPYGGRTLEIEFDFLLHRVTLRSDDGGERTVPLTAQPVAQFYADVMRYLD